MRDVVFGLVLAAATCSGLLLLPAAMARDATAILLTLIAAIYVGFSLASNGRLALTRQVAGCLFFVALALLGLWLNWWFLAAGLALHGVWDFLHHGQRSRGIVPSWYGPFCAVYDAAVALFVALYYAAAA